MPITASDIAAEAARLVGGARAETHGDKTVNFQIIADLWNGYMLGKLHSLDDGEDRLNILHLTPEDVGNMMEVMKVARRLLGSFNIDDYIDGAGYAACAGEIAAKEASDA